MSLHAERHKLTVKKRSALLGLIERLVKARPKMRRLMYDRETWSVTVEYDSPKADAGTEDSLDGLISAGEMIRSNCEVVTFEAGDPLETIARCALSATDANFRFSAIVCKDVEEFRRWAADWPLETIWQVPLIEDPATYDGGFFVVGSEGDSGFIQDFRVATFCRYPDGE